MTVKVGGVELVEAHGLADRLAGEVHEGLRLEEDDLLAVDAAFGDAGPGTCLRQGEKPWRRCDRIRRHEADIVPVVGVLGARIAETCDERASARALQCAAGAQVIPRRCSLFGRASAAALGGSAVGLSASVRTSEPR